MPFDDLPPMPPRPSSALRRRIISAYLLFTLGVCALFGVIAMFAVEGIEVRLVDERLTEIAEWASPRHAGGLPVEMPAGVSFYHGESIPLSLRGLSPGIQEKTVDGVGLHVLAGRDAAGEYVVVDHESDYEEIELVVYTIVGAGFLGCLGLALVLGRLTANWLVTPVTGLAEAVARDTPEAIQPLLARDDEMGALARSFTARTAELQQYLARERFFTGDVSHELRTPLTVITGAAELLAQRTTETPTLHAPVARIQRAVQEASECINVLLLLARAPERIDAPANDMADIIRTEMEHCQPLLANKPVSLVFEGLPQRTVFAHGELAATAIGNLLRNACQYTAAGQVLVQLDADGVNVSDTGPGVPEVIRARLQDAPLPAGAGGQRPVGANGSAGTGLGLALVRRICEHLGWQLQVSDPPGGGSCFRIVFSPAPRVT